MTTHNLTSDLIGHWNFDEGSGATANDSSGNGNNGTLQGNAAFSTDTPFGTGTSVTLDGSGDFVGLGNNILFDTLNPFSVSLWSKYQGNYTDSGSSRFPGYINLQTDTSTGFTVFTSDETNYEGINFGSNNNFTRLKTSSDISGSLVNNWRHVTIIFDGTDIASSASYKIYIDGNEHSLVSSGLFAPTPNTNRIGQASVNSTFFDGLMDDIRIYDTALGASDVAQVYAASPQWNSGSTVLNAGRDVTLNGAVSATNSGNALVVNANRNFINNAGANALSVTDPGARWLVYSSDPAANTLGGLAADFKRYNRTFVGNAPSTITEADNGLLYSIAPTLTFDVADNNVEYGEAIVGNSTTYNSGLIDGDVIGGIGQTGTANFGGYTPGDNAGTFIGAITGAIGSFANDLGYQYAFNAGDLTINKADLNISVDPTSAQKNEGDPNPIFNLSFGPFKLTDTQADLDSLPTITTTALTNSTAGSHPVLLTGGLDNNYNYIFTNGILNILASPESCADDSIIPNSVQRELIIQPQRFKKQQELSEENRHNSQLQLSQGGLVFEVIDLDNDDSKSEQASLEKESKEKISNHENNIRLQIDKKLAKKFKVEELIGEL